MQRPTVAEIDLAAIRYNYHQVRKLSDSSRKVLAIVKANAYGHGAVRISQELEKCGVDFLGVAMCEEAAELRIAGIKSRILVMGGIFHGQEDDVFKYDLNPVIYDMESARSLNARAAQNGSRLKVHVKLDTGMGRVGILPGDVEAFFSSMKEKKEKQAQKAERRAQRAEEKKLRPHEKAAEDPDIAGIVPGPQPVPWADELAED